MTERIRRMQPGERVFVDDASGDIRDKGAGVFVAGGAGVTPFIPVLRQRQRDGTLAGCTLIYSNKTEADIILREEWEGMDGLRTVFTATEEGGALPQREIDRGLSKRQWASMSGSTTAARPR